MTEMRTPPPPPPLGRSHLQTEDGISDYSMRGCQRVVGACVAQGARLSIRQDESSSWMATLSTGSGPELFAVMVTGRTQRELVFALAMKVMSTYYPRFLTREQVEAAIGGAS